MKFILSVLAVFLYLGAVSADSSNLDIEYVTTQLPSFTSTDGNPTTELHSSTLWIIVLGFILAFILAFGVGANDVANVFGTSVGAKVLTLRQACIIATVAEILGAMLLGYKVSDTVRKGILDVSMYNNTEKELMLGSLAALGGSSIWNLVATFFKLPISGTHSIVGATVGFSLCARGMAGVNWVTFAKIVASWFVSPLLSGITSVIIYVGVRHFILKKEKPLEPGLRSLPFFYGFTLLVNVFSIIHDGPQMLKLDYIPWWGSVAISVGVGLLVGLFVQCFVVPRQRKSITEYLQGTSLDNEVKFTFDSAETSRSATPPQELSAMEKGMVDNYAYSFNNVEGNGHNYIPLDLKSDGLTVGGLPSESPSSHSLGLPSNASHLPLVPATNNAKVLQMNSELKHKVEEQESPEVSKLFSFLQILTATFGSFAHGGNDVSNAIGPLIALWAIYTEGSVAQKSETPIYILLYGGLGISVGLWVWGRRVIQTIGEGLTKVTPSSGFTIEIGAAFTVLLASKIGLPISTTHCKVGSVVFVGWSKSSRQGVDWKLFRNIVLAWVVTVPLTAGASALIMLLLRVAFL